MKYCYAELKFIIPLMMTSTCRGHLFYVKLIYITMILLSHLCLCHGHKVFNGTQVVFFIIIPTFPSALPLWATGWRPFACGRCLPSWLSRLSVFCLLCSHFSSIALNLFLSWRWRWPWSAVGRGRGGWRIWWGTQRRGVIWWTAIDVIIFGVIVLFLCGGLSLFGIFCIFLRFGCTGFWSCTSSPSAASTSTAPSTAPATASPPLWRVGWNRKVALFNSCDLIMWSDIYGCLNMC